jgi:DNA-binding CsgD family transcriptional regulator
MGVTLFRSHYRVDLTPKQRQVLELVARGRTNFEIAQELGISLDGAKWHLRELFAKLDVDSREEAAAWWREYNTPRERLSRMARALLPGTIGKWLIGGAASALVVVGIVVAVLVAQGSGEPGSEQAAETVTATATTSVTPSATAPTTPSASGETIAGLPVRQLSLGE